MINLDFTRPVSRVLMTGLVTLVLSTCGGDGDSFPASTGSGAAGGGAGGGGTSIGPSAPTGIITHRDFVILYDDSNPEIFDTNGAYTQKTIAVSIHADDIFDLPVSNATVNFATEWGTFTSSDSCVLSNGTCSVNWIPGSILPHGQWVKSSLRI